MSPVQITVTAQYPGADAATLAESVAAPLESQINGIDNMLYMSSSSSSSGQLSLTVYFNIGTDPDIAQVQVAKGKKAGSYHLMMGQNPVTIVSFQFTSN